MRRVLNILPWRRARLEHELDRELHDHLDRRIDALLAEGLTAAEARQQAQRELGGLPQVREAVRDTWTWPWLDALVRDLRHASRSLARNWGFAAGAGAILALAIGTSTAVFSVFHAVLLTPLPYPDAERLVAIETLWPATGELTPAVSGPDFLDWRARSDVFEITAASYGNTDDAVLVGGRAVFANDRFVTSDFFAVFGQTAAAGRLLTERDVPSGDAEPTVAVVAHQWALTHFGSAQAALGQTVTVYATRLEIVGVAAPGFRYPGATDIWAPWRVAGDPASRNSHDYQAVAKLSKTTTFRQAQVQLRTIGDALAREHPDARLKTAALTPLHERVTGEASTTLWAAMMSVIVVWLIACANVANLQLARATGRAREIAMRAALGAGRSHVVRLLVTEGGLLALAAGLVGVLLASALVAAIVAWPPVDLPQVGDPRIDGTVVTFALGLSAAATVLFGLVPALQVSRLDLSAAMKQAGSAATASLASTTLRSVLVVAEVALSVVLLAAAGLLLRSLQALERTDLGFRTEGILVATSEYAVTGTPSDLRARTAFYDEVLGRLRAVPGVRAASGVAYLGMGREPRALRDVAVLGRPEAPPGERPQAEFHAVTADFFRTLEIPLRAGRDFDATDTMDRPQVAIINDALARAAFGGASPLGQRIRSGSARSPWMEIVGVVGDSRWQDPSRPAPPVIYAASSQGVGNSLAILARTTEPDPTIATALREFMRRANPAVPVRFETMDDLLDDTLQYPRLRSQATAVFAAGASMLAALGVFSVLGVLVGQRTRELAVRRALGAGSGEMVALIVRQGLRLVGIGLVLGLAAALPVAHLLTGWLYAVSPWDVRTYLAATALLGASGLLATVLPALRAVAIPPIVVLHQE